MEHLTLSQFQRLTKLTDSDLIAMLENGELSVVLGPLGELLVDISDLSPEVIARRASREQSIIDVDELVLIEECVASEILDAMDDVVDDAFQLVQNWQKKSVKPQD